jgi:ABC-2 type transport system ATP-binding protein
VLETLRLFRAFFDRGLEPSKVIDMVELGEKQHAWIGKLSGGQKQRLAIAAALVGDPELLFLDEPTTGLDPQSRRQLWDILRELRADGRTVLLTTHYMDEAEKLCDRVAVIDHGKVIALGTPAELIARIGGEHFIEFRVEAEMGALESAITERDMTGITDAPTTSVASGVKNTIDLSEEDLRQLPEVAQVRREEDAYILTVTAVHRTIPALLDLLASRGISLAQLTTRHASLEDVFVTLTGRHLRDDE